MKLSSIVKCIGLPVIAISLANVHLILSIITLCIGIGYGARKWYIMEVNHKKQQKNSHDEKF